MNIFSSNIFLSVKNAKFVKFIKKKISRFSNQLIGYIYETDNMVCDRVKFVGFL